MDEAMIFDTLREAIWVAVRADLTLTRNFELCAAAWIWLLVQAGGMAWMYVSFR